MDTSLPLTEEIHSSDALEPLRSASPREKRDTDEVIDPGQELQAWLHALRSFFRAPNHPLAEAEQLMLLTRDWTNELEIARQSLLHISQLAISMVHLKSEAEPAGAATTRDDSLLEGLLEAPQPTGPEPAPGSLVGLAEVLSDICMLCESLLEARPVSFYTWSTVGKVLTRELNRSAAARSLALATRREGAVKLPAALLELTHKIGPASMLAADISYIFTELLRLLERLRFVETSLQRDRPLKQTLPIFCLVHEEARTLIDFIETRALRTQGLDETIFDALDGTNYAIAMELRKVFSRELVGLSSLRQSPPIYAKVENSHGLLRDCFQQSVVGLAQLFDPTLDGGRLFYTFQTKLEQSIQLRSELWVLLQLVRRAEKERDRHPISRLLERLNTFRDGRQRYLMYKDWEACERFIEEVAAARGAVEVTPVLHRFGAYLETLHGQVNMRAVLANHPFDYPSLKSKD